jgi:hypothetical protein
MRGGLGSAVLDGEFSEALGSLVPQRPVSVEAGVSEKILANLLTAEADLIAEYRRRNPVHLSERPSGRRSVIRIKRLGGSP